MKGVAIDSSIDIRGRGRGAIFEYLLRLVPQVLGSTTSERKNKNLVGLANTRKQ